MPCCTMALTAVSRSRRRDNKIPTHSQNNHTDEGAWRATPHGVAKNQTRVSETHTQGNFNTDKLPNEYKYSEGEQAWDRSHIGLEVEGSQRTLQRDAGRAARRNQYRDLGERTEAEKQCKGPEAGKLDETGTRKPAAAAEARRMENNQPSEAGEGQIHQAQGSGFYPWGLPSSVTLAAGRACLGLPSELPPGLDCSPGRVPLGPEGSPPQHTACRMDRT